MLPNGTINHHYQLDSEKMHEIRGLISEIKWILELMEKKAKDVESLKDAQVKIEELNELIKQVKSSQTVS